MIITDFQKIPQFVRNPSYRPSVSLKYIPITIQRYTEEYGLDMNPDFQRGHVWNEQQQIRFVEYFLRGGVSGKEIYFNCKGWMGKYEGTMVLVDGKQRLQAVNRFMNNEIPAFGTLLKDFSGFLPSDASLYFNVNSLNTRAEVLQWYLDLNDGGVVHTSEEIDKVRVLLVQEKLK